MNGKDIAASQPRFHGRRKGHRLRQGRQQLVEAKLPSLRLPENLPDDLAGLYKAPISDLWLEIGFGAGEHLAHQAETHPDIGFIGAEPYINGVARLLSSVDAQDLANIRIFDDDARHFLPLLPGASIGRLFLLFSDPWPKTRHHKRRFVNSETLDQFARIMKPGAEFRFASDDVGFVRWTLSAVTARKEFQWTAAGPDDWRKRPADAIPTRYESKALDDGKQCVYLTFKRV
ncbi:MAG: tRNA (guanosine(46)-N7)-methyltransferase TrmB [Rhodospirillales bacterium]|nr:tRNA (guanosine(46)-N7)-methyltransferase TrmB [Rhodospirillales bacterium]